MITIMFLFAVMAIFVLWQLPKLRKKTSKKEISVFIGLSIIGFLLNAGLCLQVQFPNPSDGMILLFKPLSDWIYQLLA